MVSPLSSSLGVCTYPIYPSPNFFSLSFWKINKTNQNFKNETKSIINTYTHKTLDKTNKKPMKHKIIKYNI